MIQQAASPYAPPRANLDSGPTPVNALTMATARSRLAAILIDGSLLLPEVIGAIVLAGRMAPERAQSPASPQTGTLVVVAACWLYFLSVMAYQMVGLSRRGQTVGKRAMKIGIVKLDGSKPGFLHAVLLRALVNGLPGAIPVVGVLYPLIDFLFIFRADRRCVHDLIAGTRVVQVQAAPLAGPATVL